MSRGAPKAVAVYRMFDADDALIYVGQSCAPFIRPMQRLGSADWPLQVVKMLMEWFPTREEALAEEARLIKAYKPKFNIVMNDENNNRNRQTHGGKVLALWLKRNGMTVSEFGFNTGLSRKVVDKILSCEVQPSYITIQKLEKVTGDDIPDAVYCRGGFIQPHKRNHDKAVAMLAEVGVKAGVA